MMDKKLARRLLDVDNKGLADMLMVSEGHIRNTKE